MRIAIVSTYPPRPCGIASYAVAQAERLRSEGNVVTVISPPDGDGDVRVRFGSGRVFRETARRAGQFDRVIVHFQPGLYYRPGVAAAFSKIRTSLGLRALVRRYPSVEILVHEAHRPTRWRPDHVILRRALAAARLRFHTDAEHRAFERNYRLRVEADLVDHRDGVRIAGPPDRDSARQLLGLDPEETLFVCAGFIHPWKGFDRAIRAFADAGGHGHLAIVGSVRDPTPDHLTYAAELRRLANATPSVTLVEGFLREDEFDAWIRAADRLVLPYTKAWSSGALAHAAVLGTPAIVAAVGGLAEQAGPQDDVVGSDEELRQAFARVTGRSRPEHGVPARDPPADVTDPGAPGGAPAPSGGRSGPS